MPVVLASGGLVGWLGHNLGFYFENTVTIMLAWCLWVALSFGLGAVVDHVRLARQKPLDRVIALVLILWGLWVLVSESQSIWMLLRYDLSGFFSEFLFFYVSTLLFGVILPLVAVASGIGLLRAKKWAWRPARTLSLIMFVVYTMSIINLTIARYFWWNIPPPPIPDDAYTTRYSIWPAVITVIVSGVLTIVISRRSEQVLSAEEPLPD